MQAQPSLDTLFDVLAHRHRRYILRQLSKDKTTSLETLVSSIQKQDEKRRRESRKRIATSLHHIHLPKLAKADLIEYDADEGIVELAPETDETVFDLLATTSPAETRNESR